MGRKSPATPFCGAEKVSRLPTLYPALKKCRAPRRGHNCYCPLPECTGWDRCRPPSGYVCCSMLLRTLHPRLRGLSPGRVGVSASHESPGEYIVLIDCWLGWFTPLINCIVGFVHHASLTKFSYRFPSRTFAGFPSGWFVPVGSLASPRDGVRKSYSVYPNSHKHK